MKKLLGILGTITIAGSGVSGIIGNAPAPAKNEINYLQTNNSEKLNRTKREYQTNISIYVTQTNLGTIRPGVNGISNLQILNAFVRANPNLPLELRVTNQRNGIIYVSANYGDRAIIGAYSGTLYTGYVQVTFNGGQLPPAESDHIGEPSNWQSRLNLSSMTNLNRNLGNIINTNQRTIIQSFLFNNQNLPNELIDILRVSNITNGSARIYVPEGNGRYQGNLTVFFNTSFNHGRFQDEL